ncbi:hypothetical protein SFRURICE_019509 [Spodoptera frugiperda]|nr:hypothetical protein SFRURICE_019509 [Spodoptera frugiperda]
MAGCPLTVSVAAGAVGDASRVVCSGAGLAGGVLGRDIRAWLDTRRAGPGELTAHCTGPNKFSPTEPGDYRVEVRWAGRHVPGSPFPVMIFDTQEELRRYMQASAA